jgi:hypothetical protein
MFGWFRKKKAYAKVGHWYILKNPNKSKSIQYKTKASNGGAVYVVDKDGNYTISSYNIGAMYVMVDSINKTPAIDGTSIEYSSKRSPRLKVNKYKFGLHDTNFKNLYDLIVDHRLISKLDCILRNHKQSIQEAKDKTKDDILKDTHKQKCK